MASKAAPVQVPNKVLEWIYGSLSRVCESLPTRPDRQVRRSSERDINGLTNITQEYLDPRRTYSDYVYPISLSATKAFCTSREVLTEEASDNGTSALLLLLQGTIPVAFRGTTYRFPVVLWVPHAYPREAPIAFVTPTKDLVVRPGQHVSVEGRVYHPYLAGWGEHWDKSSILDFLGVLQDVFAKEPPVVSRQQQSQQQQQYHPSQQQHSQQPPPPPKQQPHQNPDQERAVSPPRPPQPQAVRHAQDMQVPQRMMSKGPEPPPPPPKPPEMGGSAALDSSSNTVGSPGAPPLPPKPGRSEQHYRGPVDDGHAVQLSHEYLRSGQSTDSRTAFEPRPPPQQMGHHSHTPPPSQLGAQARGQLQGYPQAQYYHIPPSHTQHHPQHVHAPPPLHRGPPPQELNRPQTFVQTNQLPHPHPHLHPHPHPHPHHDHHLQSRAEPSQPPITSAPKPPAPDLLSSNPLDLDIKALSTGPSAAPPIPPNPEKSSLLEHISQALLAQLETTLTRNSSALPSLTAQQSALTHTQSTIQRELHDLSALNASLASNERILADAIADADRVVADVENRSVPDVDDVLVAPTVVGEQLYATVARERSLADAMFALGRAVDRGRVGSEVFVRVTRALARERFLCLVLEGKIARGLGLEVGDGMGGPGLGSSVPRPGASGGGPSSFRSQEIGDTGRA
ncbi:MAG: hypothetical protein M1831_004536 [Alyxoria varia]|nr:MAG: hypothetical protein M1831_004536 [Alyxoria varia]